MITEKGIHLCRLYPMAPGLFWRRRPLPARAARKDRTASRPYLPHGHGVFSLSLFCCCSTVWNCSGSGPWTASTTIGACTVPCPGLIWAIRTPMCSFSCIPCHGSCPDFIRCAVLFHGTGFLCTVCRSHACTQSMSAACRYGSGMNVLRPCGNRPWR